MKKLSVIIPVAPGEKMNEVLERQLSGFPSQWEIVISSPERPLGSAELERRAVWIKARSGRANCLNAGARYATGDYIWFLHADSMLLDNTAEKIREIMDKDSDALYYFNLRFYTNKCYWVRLNEIGTALRCRFLKTPFGDQAFLLKRALFMRLPAYSTEVPYGEDHILVRDYRSLHVPVVSTGMRILTSARKYEQSGWLKTTATHVYLWRKQARQYAKKFVVN